MGIVVFAMRLCNLQKRAELRTSRQEHGSNLIEYLSKEKSRILHAGRLESVLISFPIKSAIFTENFLLCK
jgi:hypothetical protein